MVDFGVLTFVVILSIILCAFSVYKMIRERDEAFAGNHRIGVVVFAILAILTGFFEAEQQSRQRVATEVLSDIVGRKGVEVHCQRFTSALFDAQIGTLGYVSYDEPDVVLLKRDTCDDLWSYIHSDKENPTLDQITAVHILTHEAMHVEGWWAESVAECYAIQYDAATALLLGATEEQALALQKNYYENFYPNMPGAYTSRQCTDGGEMDLNLEEDRFP